MTTKITSPADLLAIAEKAKAGIDLRSGPKNLRVTIHMGTCGIAAGAREVLTAIMGELTAAGVETVTLQQTGCAGLCEYEPMVTVTDATGATFRYGKLDKAKARELVRSHLQRGQVVNEYLIKE